MLSREYNAKNKIVHLWPAEKNCTLWGYNLHPPSMTKKKEKEKEEKQQIARDTQTKRREKHWTESPNNIEHTGLKASGIESIVAFEREPDRTGNRRTGPSMSRSSITFFLAGCKCRQYRDVGANGRRSSDWCWLMLPCLVRGLFLRSAAAPSGPNKHLTHTRVPALRSTYA